MGFNQIKPKVGTFHKKTGLDCLEKNQCHGEIGTTVSDKVTKET